jgi:YVTN family beta-propeller protein
VFDVETGEQLGAFETGEEPEGVLATPDGKRVYVASEAANLVHVIDVAAQRVVKNILVGTRPRRFALTPDGRELWVSAEVAGIIDIVDTERLASVGKVEFRPRGISREHVTPVDVIMTRDGKRAYVALGRANHVAVVDVPSRAVLDYVLVGRRPWGPPADPRRAQALRRQRPLRRHHDRRHGHDARAQVGAGGQCPLRDPRRRLSGRAWRSIGGQPSPRPWPPRS